MFDVSEQLGASVGVAVLNTIAATSTAAALAGHAPTHPAPAATVHGHTVAAAGAAFLLATGAIVVLVLVNARLGADTAEDVLDSSVRVTIAADSVDTNNEARDQHLRSAGSLEVDKVPDPDVRLVRHPPQRHGVPGRRKSHHQGRDEADHGRGRVRRLHTGPRRRPRAGCTVTFEIDRNDYNVNFSKILETGGVMVGDRVSIQFDILQQN